MFRIPSSLPPEDSAPPSSAADVPAPKKKRRPAGTPDPDADVISLSPHTLLQSERYICDICHQGFQRDQNLQMHRRRHKLPWKSAAAAAQAAAAKRNAAAARKRVFVCPVATCLHHDPRHALGDLVGIKKHFRRKHSANRQWACARCAKAYAVHSDFKAHLKTCGTRGHSCDCGRVFSRVEAFIEHQHSCPAATTQPPPPPPPPANSYNIDLHLSIAPPPQPPAGGPSMNFPREEARRQAQIAERELAAARRLRQQARAELEKAYALRNVAAKQINTILLQITCGDCKQKIVRKPAPVTGGDGFGPFGCFGESAVDKLFRV